MTTIPERTTELLRIADRASLESLLRVAQQFRERVEYVCSLDQFEFSTVSSLMYQPVVGASLQAQGTQVLMRVTELMTQLDDKVQQLAKCVSTPPRMASMGRSWIEEIKKVDEMIDRAEQLMELEGWEGVAADAHRAVVPKQVMAMFRLRSQAVTACEAVIAVGALQNTIFDASAWLLASAALEMNTTPVTAVVPSGLFSRAIGLLTLLPKLLVEIDKQITGDGTWAESADTLVRALENASANEGFEWPSATAETGGVGEDGERGDDVEGEQDEETAEDESTEEETGDEASDDEAAGDDAEVEGSDDVEGDEDSLETDPEAPEDSGAAGDADGGEASDGDEGGDDVFTLPPVPGVPTPDPLPPLPGNDLGVPEPHPEPVPEPDPEPGPDPVESTPTPDPTPEPPLAPAVPDPEPTPTPPPPTPAPPAPTPEPPPPVDILPEYDWEQIAKDRELAEEALFPQPVEPVEPPNGGKGGELAAQMLR